MTGRRAAGWITQLTSNTPLAISIAIAAMVGRRGFCTSVHSFWFLQVPCNLGHNTSHALWQFTMGIIIIPYYYVCLLYTSPSPRDATLSRMPSSA